MRIRIVLKTKKQFWSLAIVELVHTFFISDTFINNAKLKLAKNQANAKQKPEAEFSLFGKYLHSSSTLSSRSHMTYSKKYAK